MKKKKQWGKLSFSLRAKNYIHMIYRIQQENLPKRIKKEPPITGSGTVTKRAPNLLNTPRTIINMADICTTRLLPTWEQKMYLLSKNEWTIQFLFKKLKEIKKNGKYCQKIGRIEFLPHTLVIPTTPTLTLVDVVPFPVPNKPSRKLPTPSINIPETRNFVLVILKILAHKFRHTKAFFIFLNSQNCQCSINYLLDELI